MYNTANDTSKPLISFIVTTHNLPDTMLRECVGSIMTLSMRPAEREIIVVDDGSDECALNGLADIREHIIYMRQRHQGLSVARNIGLRIASGQYIQFIDGDDKLLAEGYGHCIDIVRYNDPDMVLFDMTDKTCVESVCYIPEPVDGTQYMRHNNIYAAACGYAFNRRILLDLRFTPGRLHEDEEFTPQLFLRAARVYSTNIPAYYYRKRKSSITRSSDKKTIVKRLNDVEQILFHLQDIAASLPLVDRQALSRRVAQLTMDYIFNIIRLTRSTRQLDERLERLEKRGLFPLPDQDYTKKYMLFRRLANSRLARKMLSLALR